MSEKESTNVQASDTANDLPTNLSTSRYTENKDFNEWWKHWMSKVPYNRLSAKNTLPSPEKSSYPPESTETTQEKDAA